MGPRRVRQIVVAGAVTAGVGSEVLCNGIADFWVHHPLTSSLVSALLVLAAAAVFVEEVVARRRATRRLRIAQTAYRELSTVGFDVMVAIVRAADGDPGDFDGMGPAITAKLKKPKELADFLLAIKEQSERAAAALAGWAPVMLQEDDLAEDLALFAEMRDDLLCVPRIVFAQQPGWEDEAGRAFTHFVSTFALFNAARALMLGEAHPDDFTEADSSTEDLSGVAEDSRVEPR